MIKTACACLGALLIACGGSSDPPSPWDDDGGEDGAAPGTDAGAGGDGDAEPDGGAENDRPDYARLFPLDRVIDVEIDFDGDGWATLLADPLEDVYVPATIVFDGVTVEDVAVRFKGNSSRWELARQGGTRYSLKVDTDEYVAGQRLLGVDKINFNNGFNDPTQLREVLASEMFAAAGVPSPQMGFARITIDGELLGTYVSVEQVDRDFLRRHFADDTGDLYKPEMPDGYLEWRGPDLSAYEGMELKTNEDASDGSAVLRFLDVLNNTPDEDLEAALPSVLDVDRFVRFLAMTALQVYLDSLVGMGHNYYLYEDRPAGRFVVVPWDMNGSFGWFNCGMGAEELLDFSFTRPACRPYAQKVLVRRVLSVPSLRAAYEEALLDLADGPFSPDLVAERVSELAGVLRPSVAEDPTRFFTPDQFETGLHDDQVLGQRTSFGLTSFVERRLAEVDEQLP
jgi:hypothetical protein